MLKDILKFRNLVINVFIGDESYPSLDGNIFVLYKFSGKQEFIAYEENIKEHELYVTAYDPDESHLMMVFKVPQHHKADYELLKDSKYSKISEEYKTRILTFHAISKNHPVSDVLYRPESAYRKLEDKLEHSVPRGQEVSSKLDKTREYYSSVYKIMAVIAPNKKFDNKPLTFNTKEGE
jgi:hypothetical protein